MLGWRFADNASEVRLDKCVYATAVDALESHEGETVFRVILRGNVTKNGKRYLGNSIGVLWSYECGEVLEDYAITCARGILHLWSAPDHVVRYLETREPRHYPKAKLTIESLHPGISETEVRDNAIRATNGALGLLATTCSSAKSAMYWSASAESRHLWLLNRLYQTDFEAWDVANAAVMSKQNDRLERMLHEGRPKC